MIFIDVLFIVLSTIYPSFVIFERKGDITPDRNWRALHFLPIKEENVMNMVQNIDHKSFLMIIALLSVEYPPFISPLETNAKEYLTQATYTRQGFNCKHCSWF